MQKILIIFRRYLWFFTRVFRVSYFRIYLFVNLFFSVVSFAFAWFLFKNINSNLMFLHYNVIFGIDKVGNPKDIFVLPFLSLAVFILNTIISISFFKNKHFQFISHLLSLIAMLFSIVIILSLLSLYLVNFK